MAEYNPVTPLPTMKPAGVTPLAATNDGSHLSGAALLPYMGSVSVDGWADPTFNWGQNEVLQGNDSQSSTGMFSPYAEAFGTQSGTADPNKLYNTSDLSRFAGNIGMDLSQFGPAPDYSKFYDPGTAKQLVSVAGNDSGTETWYDNPDYKAA